MRQTRYNGKVCSLHPELKGERLRSNSRCICCHNTKRHAQTKRKYWSDVKWRSHYLKQRSRLKKKWNRFAQYTAKYRAALKKRTPTWANFKKIAAIYTRAARLGKVVDHVVPLQGREVSGLHVHNNLRIVTQRVNDQKGNKLIQGLL